MPSDEIMSDFAAGKLHSGKGGPIVEKKSQALAILESYRRKEGKEPQKRGGMVQAAMKRRAS